MPYSYPGLMFDHTLTALKGWPQERPLDIEGTLSTNVNIGSVNSAPLSGQCVHVQSTSSGVGSNGNGPNIPVFEMGAKQNMMPLFLIPSGNDFDVQNPGVTATVLAASGLGGSTTNPPAWVPIRPTGKLVALVAKGPYELETTEYDTNQTYAPNDLLRTVTSNTDSNAGKMTNQDASGGQPFATTAKLTLYTDSAVGRVSRGTYTNAAGKSALAFWPESIPGSR